jgi:ABC-2 type transport system permease protein
MIRSIYGKAMWDQRRSLLGWGSGIAAMILLEGAMWPSIRDMPRFDEYLRDFPSALKELFAIDQMATGKGFLNAELFTLMLPMLFLVFGISRGARMIAGEEEAGTLDLLLVSPVSTSRLLIQEALALTTGMLALGGAAFLATVAGSQVFGLGVPATAAMAGSLAMVLLGLEFGLIALTAGALTGRRALAIAIPSGLAMLAYLLFAAGLFVDRLSGWQKLSPFQQALHAGPLSPGVPVSFLWLLAGSVVVISVALPIWGRRDIGVHA